MIFIEQEKTELISLLTRMNVKNAPKNALSIHGKKKNLDCGNILTGNNWIMHCFPNESNLFNKYF